MSRVYWAPDEEFNSGTEDLLFTHVQEEDYHGEVSHDTYRLMKRKPDDYMWGAAVEGMIEHSSGRRVTAEPKRLSGPPHEESGLPLPTPEGTQVYRAKRGGFRNPMGTTDPQWDLARSFEFTEHDQHLHFDPMLTSAFGNIESSETGVGVAERPPTAVVDYLKASRGHDIQAMAVLGAMVQRHEEMHGTDITSSTDLSPHSAPIVRKLQRLGLVDPNRANVQTNNMGFPTMRYDTYPEEIEQAAAIDRVDPAELRSGRKYLVDRMREAEATQATTPEWNDRREAG